MKLFDLFGSSKSSNFTLNTNHHPLSYHVPVPEMDGAPAVEEEEPKRSLGALATAIVMVVAILATQCFRLQVLLASQNRTQAEGNSVRIITQPADRGLVVDTNGVLLAQNDRKVALTVTPQTLPNKRADREAVYTLLRERAKIPEDQIAFIENNRDKISDAIPIKVNLTKDDSLLYWEWFHDVPGLQVAEIPTRHYADLTSLGQLLGYVGTASQTDIDQGSLKNERVGKSGLEKQYNTELSGIPGKLHAEVNAQGEIIRYISDTLTVQPQVGQTLKLTLDSKLQQVVADALRHELERRKQKYGDQPKLGASAVVMNPKTGAILAMVSLPDYSTTLFAQGITQEDYQQLLADPGNPLLNRAIQGVFAPGSTIKPLVASGGLQEGVISADTTVVTPDAITLGNFRLPDWKYHGLTNTRKAIAESNNVFFAAVGGGYEPLGIKGLGVDRLNTYLAKFGLGQKTGVDLPGEASGLLPDGTWKKKQAGESWYIGDTYHSSIGQGYLLTTPLQMASATAAIANGGTVWQPHIAQSFINPATSQESPVTPLKAQEGFVSPSNIKVVQEGMREAVLSGSARFLNELHVTSAGKTGTAQFGNQGLTHAWYTGYAPYEDPQIAFSILIEGGGESFYSSVPVAEEILRGYFNEPLAPGEKLISEPGNTKTAELAAEFQGER
jgi:penicillin-binding protein 2